MKGLYKKISAIVLAGMVVLGGGAGALGGVQKVDAVSWLEIKVQGQRDVEALAKEYKFKILVGGSSKRVDEYVKKEVKRKVLKDRLSKPEESFKYKYALKSYIEEIKKGKVKMHRFEYQGLEYIILF